jgi:hypothetical protein
VADYRLPFWKIAWVHKSSKVGVSIGEDVGGIVYGYNALKGQEEIPLLNMKAIAYKG